jgi:twitching motility protein PilT
VGVVAQRLRFHEGQKLLVPECEVLMASTATRAVIRQGQFFKLVSSLETGASDGSFTFARYGEWLSRKTDFVHPSTTPEPLVEAPAPPKLARAGAKAHARRDTVTADGTLVLDEEDGDLSQIVDALEKD